MEPEQPSPDTEHESLHEEAHLPPPTLWPIGFAIGIVVVLVGLVIDPLLISSIGAAIAIVFAILWAREATAEMRGEQIVVEPERQFFGGKLGIDATAKWPEEGARPWPEEIGRASCRERV